MVVLSSLPILALFPSSSRAFAPIQPPIKILRSDSRIRTRSSSRLYSDWNKNNGAGDQDSNQWFSMDDDPEQSQDRLDWQDSLQQKKDGSFWSSFEPSNSSTDNDNKNGSLTDNTTSKQQNSANILLDEDSVADAWLETLAYLSAEEVQFNIKEADRADKVRKMQEWGFTSETISNTLGVAMDISLEAAADVKGMQDYREQSYLEEIDLQQVESHTRVPIDEESGEPIRSQMVYVDEHTCIGCTNCAMIAQSTFFMHSEHGRARVFQQWGDDDETIQIAIETCPVDCIHYVPYEELVALEVERRDQNINFKARLVSQAEYGNSLSHRVGGPNVFTAPQRISGNMGARCNNCPTRGCRNCPMYGVGKNPEYERKEKERKERLAKKRLQEERENAKKSAEL